MPRFVLRRLATMTLTMLCLTLSVFFLVNLEPNLKKLALTQTEQRASAQEVENWLARNGYRQSFLVRYGQWLGVVQKQPNINPATGEAEPRFRFCSASNEPRYSGILQGDFGCSTAFRINVADKLLPSVKATGILMAWVRLHYSWACSPGCGKDRDLTGP
jgi:peptide/nickel transport system permease protein